jgi:hypothetical protein
LYEQTDNGDFVVSYDLVEKDLAHIRNVISFLEHSNRNLGACDAEAVIGLHWWRARIQAVLAMPRLPIHVERQARDMLCRLNELEGSRRRMGTV